ncbi:50S ribosomal protein L6, partial [Patescibacteria group bacterium]|nr:50S ribosomal protein L6 [Patescibacteria group bacterium]
MSRIGKKPILIPEKVDVKIDNDFVIVKGPKGELKQKLIPEIKLNFSDDKKELNVDIKNKDVKKEKALWGTFRQLINNMIIGVTEGFEKKLEINGVGYKAVITGKTGSASGGELVLNVGFSHPVNFKIPKNIDIAVEKNLITISGIDKQLVG